MKIADEYLDPGCLMRGHADEDGLCSYPCPSCVRERRLRELRKRSIRSLLGEYGRQILRQYNEAGFNHCASLTFHGPHYVTYESRRVPAAILTATMGALTCATRSRCRPEFRAWARLSLLWTFMVIG
jgi:hypothetical protein